MTIPLPAACSVTLLTATLGLAFATGDAHAATPQRSFIQNATGACQSALPVFEGQIRKRPLAIQNEGTASTFISCSLMGTDRSVAGITEIDIVADNNTASPVDLTCTLVTGLSKFGMQQFFPKTITMPANSGINEIFWDSRDNGGAFFDNFTVNVSCNLLMGTGLSRTRVFFNEDVGA
ncbi:MAG: hypothetical protein ABJA62_08455 [Luteimonas sp.]